MSKSIVNDLYTFAYCLIPDDLQASQLVLDAFSSALLEREITGNFNLTVQGGPLKNLNVGPESKLLLKKIYELGKKRVAQMATNEFEGLEGREDAAFYRMRFEERAVLALRHRFKMNLNNIAYIINSAKVETINQLFLARTTLASP